MSNSSSFDEFLLRAFADTRELQLLHFSLFLGVYLAALLGNGLIITAIACDHHLHTSMYFFLLSLSVLDLGTISTTVPKSMANSLWDTRAISYSGCAAQVFLVVFLFTVEYILLTVMAYDRFIAICKPLHYRTIMGSRACVRMAAAVWAIHKAPRKQMSNSSSFNEFLLLAFADTQELQLLHFLLFLGIYLAALLGNGLIITAVACDHHLHTPMYFFLLNLSLLDLGIISTTVPKSMANSLWDTRAISYSGCAAQAFFFFFLFATEFHLLTVMAYDRFVAICRPLHYRTLMDSRACVKMAAAAWASGSLHALLHTANTFSIPLCQGNTVDQFFCEVPQILKLSCSDAYLREVGLLAVGTCLSLGCFIFIVVSYVQIVTVVLRIPSEQGRHKAFSMCLPHLAVVSLFVSTVMFAYLKPPSLSSPSLDLVVAVLYSVVPPAVNPLIYSMRNKELKDALRKLVQLVLFQQQ
ncbi:olfactory receptor 14A16-like [Dromaius novaehollandiae]|uniref:olfactory receptor 14A16-like n=1 Tax=Dromaius novaehollandiae TaxID=8790 RepID=UPI00311DB0C4